MTSRNPRTLFLLSQCMMPSTLPTAPADPFELLRDGRIGIGAERRVAVPRAFPHHGDGMVEVQTCRVCLARFLHPDGDLLCRPVQRLADLADGSVVAEQQPRGLQRGELAHRGERGLVVEVGGWRRGPDVPRFGEVNARCVADVQVSGVGVDEADVMLGVTGGVVAVQAPAAAEVDGPDIVERDDAVGGNGNEHAEKPVKRGAIDHPGTGHQPARVGEVPRAPLVRDDLGRREHRGDVAGPARVIQVNMSDHDGGQVVGADPEPGQCVTDHRRGRRRPGFHQARPVGPDQVAGRDPVVSGHPGVDLEYLVPEIGDVRRFDSFSHAVHSIGRAERTQD